VLNGLARNISKVNAELDQINAEIEQATSKSKGGDSEMSLRNMQQWFDVYGRPSHAENHNGLLTTFHQSPKIYGGTAHHRSFKSVSSVMRKGRMTR
jgi:hypothetical protein